MDEVVLILRTQIKYKTYYDKARTINYILLDYILQREVIYALPFTKDRRREFCKKNDHIKMYMWVKNM